MIRIIITGILSLLPAGCLLEMKFPLVKVNLDGKDCGHCHDGTMPFSAISGHGFTGLYKQTQHGKKGPGYRCTVCHNPNLPGHLDAVPGDNLLKIDNRKSELCLDCHRVGQTENGALGHRAFSQASKHSAGVTGKYDELTDYHYECHDCHNPHGTAQLAMIKDTIDGRLGAGPYAVLLQDSLDFNPDWDEADSIHESEGVCDVCHLPGKPAHSRTEEERNHESGRPCWQCHFHTASFDTITTHNIGLMVSPPSWKLSLAESWKFKAKLKSNLEKFTDISAWAQWLSLNPAVISVDDSGLVTGVSEGTGKVAVTYLGFSDTAEVQVNP